jgi:hypothetical protein
MGTKKKKSIVIVEDIAVASLLRTVDTFSQPPFVRTGIV